MSRSLTDTAESRARRAAVPVAASGRPAGAGRPAEPAAVEPAAAEHVVRARTEPLAAADAALSGLPALRAPALFLNRETTWLSFTSRVLHEAEDPRNPLLERVKFLAIVSSNLDEFFMKRIGGLKQQVGAGIHALTVDGRTPSEQIAECLDVIRDLERRKRDILVELKERLGERGVILADAASLPAGDRAYLRDYYVKNIFPLVTPQAMDPAHPFPFVSNLSLNLLVMLRHGGGDRAASLARVKVPVGAGTPRFLQLRDQRVFVALEDVMAQNLDLLFPGMKIDGCAQFRVTRNAVTELDEEEADDLLAMIEIELRERKFAPIVRLEVDRAMPAANRASLAAEFEIDEAADLFEVSGTFRTSDLMEIAALDIPELHDPPHHPLRPPELAGDRSVFHIIRDAGAILLHHPYQSFSASVERFLREASEDPQVRAIKMTLYRTSSDTQVIKSLVNAARNGKQVAVVVELKARFDEQANIQWAGRLEQVGIHVTYGIVGLKTHAKVTLVVRQDYDGLRRYAHIGTGNYHAGTARIYDDLGLLTCDDAIGSDLTELFNYLTTGYKPGRKYQRVLPGPKILKKAILAKIEREIARSSPEAPGCIQLKLNALEDADITRALYRASMAGVTIDLIVRDTCRLRPGLPGLSETVTVKSIVGRFLEHSRIYYFRNGGREEYYIGSADLMKRNLESRVEAVVSVEDPDLRAELRKILDIQLADERNAWEMQPDGSYVQYEPRPGHQRGSQELLAGRTEKKRRKSVRLKKRRLRGPGRARTDELE